MGGRDQSERMVAINRNHWSQSAGARTMPLGAGYSVEEQVTGEAEWGGLQISIVPLKATVWQARCKFAGNNDPLRGDIAFNSDPS